MHNNTITDTTTATTGTTSTHSTLSASPDIRKITKQEIIQLQQ